MEQFDVFLSHSSKDKPTVRQLAQSLQARGLKVWLDEEQLVPGRPWQEALEPIIQTSRTAAVLVGKDGLGPWEIPEMRACLSEFVHRALPVIPVLLPGAPVKPELPLFLRDFTWVDLRDGFLEDGFDRLEWGITGVKPGGTLKSDRLKKPEYRPGIVRPELQEVFTTVGLPKFTYIEPTIYRRFSQAVRTPGKHIVLEGTSGVGKTCLVFRVLAELGYVPNLGFIYISAREDNSANRILSLLRSPSSPGMPNVVFIDDVHILQSDIRHELADQLKLMSDGVFINQAARKCILAGIPTAASGLLANAVDLGPRLATFKLGMATDKQLDTLIHEGEERLAVRFRDHDVIIKESNGSFYLCQFICHKICFSKDILEAQAEAIILHYQIEDVRSELMKELHNRYIPYTLQFCKGGNNKVEKKSGYIALLASLTRIPKSVIHLNEILLDAGPYSPSVSKVLDGLRDMLNSEKADSGLSRLVHYDDSIETFSIENPAFRYYLNNLSIREVLDTLGLHDTDFEAHYCKNESVIEINTEMQAKKLMVNNKKVNEERDLVFVSYSHADAMWMDRIRVHLAPLARKNLLSIWSDIQIRAGSSWRSEIDQAISAARVAVLLVSADYLASDFITDTELPALLAKAENEGLKIIWVPISPCLWEVTSISHYQAVHDPKRPLLSLPAAEQEEVLVKLSQEIIRALDS